MGGEEAVDFGPSPCWQGEAGRGLLLQEIWKNARRLRHDATDAERVLWRHLRSRQVQGLKFRRQFPIAGFIADFACVEARLVIELDGGQHADRVVEDQARSARLVVNGYRVLRFWNDDVLKRTEDVLAEIWRQVLTPPQPSPASRGGGQEQGNDP